MKYLSTTLGALSLTILLTSCAQQQQLSRNEVVDETYVHRYGVAVPQNFWASSGEHGAVVSTMSNGVVVSKGYESGVLQGDTTYSYPHSSQIQKKEVYEQGSLTNVVDYFFDGTPQSETVFDIPTGAKTVSTWYLSGTPRSVEIYNGGALVSAKYYNAANQCDSAIENGEGTRLVRDDYGLLVSTDFVEKGQLISRTTYHTNGSPKEQIPYANQLVDGTKRSFFPDGEPNTIEQWKAGRQEGMTVTYQHGEKLAEVPYQGGVKQGVEKRYRDGTTLVQEVSWSGGQQHGSSTTYVGDTKKVEWYYQGCPTTESDYYFMVNKPVVR